MLQKTHRPRTLTHADIEARDNHVRAIYRARRLHTPAAQTTDTEPTTTRRANQWCWMCEQRRICTQTPQRWECSDCLQTTYPQPHAGGGQQPGHRALAVGISSGHQHLNRTETT
ncbi:hypothetical protein ACFWCF_17570 [Rhodococcus sp. NPDC060090]|uniref:hypothetical protein n=1 Tax=Rhodococcus sp. NPDC060090 TaxID=3347056 RepID=UPI003663D8CA